MEDQKMSRMSGVVDHEPVRLTMFFAEHNDLKINAADFGNAYLHGTIRDKKFIIAGKECREI